MVKSGFITGCRNKRLFAQYDAGWNYKFDLETTPEGMRTSWLKETETHFGIEYCVRSSGGVHKGVGRGGSVSFKDAINC
jgi:hypothetical protein